MKWVPIWLEMPSCFDETLVPGTKQNAKLIVEMRRTDQQQKREPRNRTRQQGAAGSSTTHVVKQRSPVVLARDQFLAIASAWHPRCGAPSPARIAARVPTLMRTLWGMWVLDRPMLLRMVCDRNASERMWKSTLTQELCTVALRASPALSGLVVRAADAGGLRIDSGNTTLVGAKPKGMWSARGIMFGEDQVWKVDPPSGASFCTKYAPLAEVSVAVIGKPATRLEITESNKKESKVMLSSCEILPPDKSFVVCLIYTMVFKHQRNSAESVYIVICSKEVEHIYHSTVTRVESSTGKSHVLKVCDGGGALTPCQVNETLFLITFGAMVGATHYEVWSSKEDKALRVVDQKEIFGYELIAEEGFIFQLDHRCGGACHKENHKKLTVIEARSGMVILTLRHFVISHLLWCVASV
ncbi:hypothetical protein Pelo_6759 [Pelomyxa schiedti]|nr:hypothetical protein Pelo_6759 [Pelomyxa schiedti]